MGVYVHKLSTKTIEAQDKILGEKVKVAFAPYWTKAYGDFYNCLEAINQYKEDYESPQLYAGGVNKIREDERRCAFTSSPSQWEKQMFTHLKRGVSAGERAEKKMKEEGVTRLIFWDKKTLDKYEHAVVYDLHGWMYYDTPDYGTPEIGILIVGKNGNFIAPYSKMLLDSLELKDYAKELAN